MAIEQYRTGAVRVVTGSKVVHGISTSWNNGTIQEGHKFKLDADGSSAYTVATILTATQLVLSSSYVTGSLTAQSYMVTRSFTPYRNYARLYQGDSDAADIIRDQVINPIDTDIGKLYNGTASLDNVLLVSPNGSHYWDIDVNASGETAFSYNGVRKAFIATSTGAWMVVS